MKSKVRIFAQLSALILLGLLALSEFTKPIQNGRSLKFWSYACGIDLEEAEEIVGDTYLPLDGYYIYYYQGMHGQFLYKVPALEANQDYPAVLKKIEELPDSKTLNPRASLAKRVLHKHRARVIDDPEAFLRLLHKEEQSLLDKELQTYQQESEAHFSERWTRANRYWVNILFEFCFFVAVLFFALYPWMYSKSHSAWGFHLGFTPLFIMMPYYLGYAPYAFTSADPKGGVLYPYLIELGRVHFWTSLDTFIFEQLPPILEPLSQSPGSILSMSESSPLGPVVALMVGAAMGILAAGIHKWRFSQLPAKSADS